MPPSSYLALASATIMVLHPMPESGRELQARLAQAQADRGGESSSVRSLRSLAEAVAESPAQDLIHGSVGAQEEEGRLWLTIASRLARTGEFDEAAAAIARLEFLDRPEEALDSLEGDAFAGVRNTADGQRLVRKWRSQKYQWSDSAFVTPFRDTLPATDRLAGLALLWAEVRYSSAGLGRLGVRNWDSSYVATIQKVLAPMSTWDYYCQLADFVRPLDDGHTDVTVPATLARQHFSSIPATATSIGGRYYVDEVRSPTIINAGLTHGQEIVAIDGLAVDEYIERSMARWTFASTDQARQAYRAQFLFAGELGTTLQITILDSRGERRTIALRRGSYPDAVRISRVPASVTFPESGVAYARVTTFAVDSVADVVQRGVLAGGPLHGFILDLRHNGGGAQVPGWRILSHFLREPVTLREQYSRNYVATLRAWGHQPAWVRLPERVVTPATPRWNVPVVLLIGPGTGSAAEGVTAVFRQAGIGTIVGEPTAGSTGQPLFIPMPGGGSARVRTEEERYSNREAYIGVGIQPDITVERTVADFRAGRDAALEVALDTVRRSHSSR